MGWTSPGRYFLRDFAAVLLFVHPRDSWRDRRDLGAHFLLFRPGWHHGQPMFYAGYTVAGSFPDWFVFLCPLDHHRKIDGVRSRDACHFIIDLDQTAERDHRGAARLHLLSARRKTATPARSG